MNITKSLLILITACVITVLMSTTQAQTPTSYFSNWPQDRSPQNVGLKAAKALVKREHYLHPDNNTIHYAEAVAWYGALDLADQLHDKALLNELEQRFLPLTNEDRKLIPPGNHVDFSVFGVVPLQLYLQTSDVRYRLLGLAFADGQWDRPQADGLTNQTRYWIDDMYMITALQTAAYRATHDEKYIDHAAREMTSYLKKLQQPNGLFHHSLESSFYWGRGNGWVAAGMTELLRVMPAHHPQRNYILSSYRKMMASLLKYQAMSGLWRQLVDHEESWEETSGSAMFTFAFVTGVQQEWLPAKKYGPA
ncbi:MAG TPA: glycoside hydrolase family 88 protein, partial [Steroidobacteraceae bacterium]|nr:glycoside hydrolase family 88 protein [Steroidobacteraceae bacterium]